MSSPKARPTDRLSPREGVGAREFDGEWIVLDLRGGNYFGLDELGGSIWSHLSSGRSPAEIAALLSCNYDVADSTLLRDVLALVDELLERDLVRLNE